MNKDTLLELIQQNLSQRQLAKFFNCSQCTIKYWLKNFQLKTLNKSGNVKDFTCKCGETNSKNFLSKGNGKKFKCLCKKCHNNNCLKRFRNNKLMAIEYKGGKCICCGYNKCAAAMTFHHRDPKLKDSNFETLRNRKFDDKVKLELDKCDLLCCRCHTELHADAYRGYGDNGNTVALQVTVGSSILPTSITIDSKWI